MMGMAQSFGRQQPLAFLGAAALAGFMASRFAQASAQSIGWITATTFSPISSSGAPTTAASATFGCVTSRFSISCG